MKNQVIEVLNKEHGKKVIEYWKSRGVDTVNRDGTCTRCGSHQNRYYGFIDGEFNNYDIIKKYQLQ